MKLEQNSIKAHLIKMQLLVTSVVLFICSVSFIVNDILIFKKHTVANLDSSARILGANLSSTIAFMDEKEAAHILSSLKAEPDIISAQVFDKTGKPFASYGSEIQTELKPIFQMEPKLRIDGRRLYFHHKLYSEKDFIGTLLLVSGTKAIEAQALNYLLIAVLVLCSGIAIAFILARYTQRPLSNPIISLVRVTKKISDSGDYSLRVGALSEHVPDEISVLSHEFDRMIDQIQAKENAIKLANQMLEKTVEERTTELRETQKVAIQNAHSAGMTEITTGTLHNVGNIMNSVNIALTEIDRTLKNSRSPNVLKAALLMGEHLNDLEQFLTADLKGKALPDYLMKATEELERERAKLILETEQLAKGIGMVKDVIVTQQSYAKGIFMAEELKLEEILEDVLAMQSATLQQNQIQVRRLYATTPLVKAQKAKLAHIVLNLVKNALEAMSLTHQNSRFLTIETGRNSDQSIYIKITDTGEGIPEEISKKIFNHGFTTKKSGHGFGLHYCANAMVEMGGRLSLHSDGIGKGATFTLLFLDKVIQDSKIQNTSNAA